MDAIYAWEEIHQHEEEPLSDLLNLKHEDVSESHRGDIEELIKNPEDYLEDDHEASVIYLKNLLNTLDSKVLAGNSDFVCEKTRYKKEKHKKSWFMTKKHLNGYKINDPKKLGLIHSKYKNSPEITEISKRIKTKLDSEKSIKKDRREKESKRTWILRKMA
jgi:hypothetical protein